MQIQCTTYTGTSAGTSAGNNMDHEPGTGDGKPGTRDDVVLCMCVHARILNKFTLVYK